MLIKLVVLEWMGLSFVSHTHCKEFTFSLGHLPQPTSCHNQWDLLSCQWVCMVSPRSKIVNSFLHWFHTTNLSTHNIQNHSAVQNMPHALAQILHNNTWFCACMYCPWHLTPNTVSFCDLRHVMWASPSSFRFSLSDNVSHGSCLPIDMIRDSCRVVI